MGERRLDRTKRNGRGGSVRINGARDPLRAAFCILLVVAAAAVHAATEPNAGGADLRRGLVVVSYTEADSAHYGARPSRSLTADVIKRVRADGATWVLPKFFYDQPGRSEDDAALLDAIRPEDTMVQATISKEPPTSTSLESRLFFQGPVDPDVRPRLLGTQGWLPFPALQRRTDTVCFADVPEPHAAPLVERFRGGWVKTVYTCVLEAVLGSPMTSLDLKGAHFGKRFVPVDGSGEARVALRSVPPQQGYSYSELLRGSVPADALRGKVVLILFAGSDSPTIAVDGVAHKVHDVFLEALLELEDEVR